MRCKALRQGFPLVAVGILFLPTILFAQGHLSHVRVVRLSYLSGTVGVKSPASTEWAKAQVNTPIQEGFEVSTSANSYAEVEFENGSTARLGELSRVSFDQLAMNEKGDKLNRLMFAQGYGTFHFLPEHHDEYSVKVADATVTPHGKSQFRTDFENGRVRVEVFSGSVEVAAATQTVKLSKDKVLEFEPQAPQVALAAKQGIVKDSWDKWASARDTQTQLSVADQAVPSQGPLYGWGDLNAYGEWGYFPGFGYGWSPFASAGWSPYSMGMWSLYPGMGYTWISSEPWGWLPYHYGSWNMSPGFGWFWMPGNMQQWSPALVNWYSGPGWVGWAPLGAMGAAGQGIVTAVPGGVIQNGLMVGPHNVSHLPITAGNMIRHMPFQPGAGALLPGPRLSAGVGTAFTAHAGVPRAMASHTMAPPSILMGGDGGREISLQSGRAAHQPLRARLGPTLGGHYSVGGTVGEFHGDAFRGAHGAGQPMGMRSAEFSRGGMSGPVLMPHGQQGYISPGFGRGGMMPRGGGVMPSGGGGNVNAGGAMRSMGSPGSGHSAASTSGGGHH